MATTGTKVGSFSGSTSSYASLIAEWSYTQNVNNNTTTLTVKLKVRRDKSGSTTYKTSTPYSLTVDGTTKSGNYNFDITSISVGSSKTITTITKTLTHNTDGTYKTVSISGKFDLSGTTLGTGTVSTSLTVDTIPRATTPTVSASSVNMGADVTFTLNRASSDFTHTLTYSFEGASGTIGTDIGTSKSWTVPDLASKIPNKTSGTCTITCTTYNGSESIGKKSITMTLKVPSSVKPTVSINVSEAVSKVSSTLGVYVKNLSKLKITANGSGMSGSTITAYSIKANGVTYNTKTVETGYLTSSGAMTITATVTDSRGRTGSTSTTITVVNYSKPYITTFKAERTTGSNVSIVLNGGVTNISGNTATYTLEYKKKDDSDYTNYNISDTTSSINKTITLSDIDPNYQYTFKFTVSDPFYSTVLTYDVGTEFTLMDFNSSGKGLALGKVSESDGLECDLESTFNKKVSFKNDVEFYAPWIDIDPTSIASVFTILEDDLYYPPQYRKIGNHVYIRGRLATTADYDGESITVFKIPSKYRPSATNFRTARVVGPRFGSVYVGSLGNLTLEWIWSLETGRVTGALKWVDISIDYFID